MSSIDFRHARPYRLISGSEDNTVALFEGPPFKFLTVSLWFYQTWLHTIVEQKIPYSVKILIFAIYYLLVLQLSHEHTRFVYCVRYNAVGSLFASSGADGKVQ